MNSLFRTEPLAARPLPADGAGTTLMICTTCKSEEGEVGAALYQALQGRLEGEPVALRPVECFAVCKRPCTLALTAPGKWTYVVGDLRSDAHIEDIVVAARRYGASPDGLVPWRERPLPFRKGIVSRTPPALNPSR
jgi:predicted metal-binding protein